MTTMPEIIMKGDFIQTYLGYEHVIFCPFHKKYSCTKSPWPGKIIPSCCKSYKSLNNPRQSLPVWSYFIDDEGIFNDS